MRSDNILPETLPRQQDIAPNRQWSVVSQWPVRALDECSIVVLIPCYNEEITIGKVVSDFARVIPQARIYVYDNNSHDMTIKRAIEAGAIVRREEQQGKGHVVRRMFRDIDADLYVLVDGDDTYEAAKVLDMLSKAVAGPYDLVNGVRRNAGGAFPRGHVLGNRLLTGMVRLLFGDRIQDSLSGYKVLSRRFVKSFPTLTAGFEIETELAVHALELSMPIAHVDIVYSERPVGSTSKLKTFRDGFKILFSIFDLIKQERPLFLFSIISLIVLLIGLGFSVPMLIDAFQTGAVPHVPAVIVSTGLFIVSFLAFVTGLLLDMIARGRREAKMLQYLSFAAIAVDSKHHDAEMR